MGNVQALPRQSRQSQGSARRRVLEPCELDGIRDEEVIHESHEGTRKRGSKSWNAKLGSKHTLARRGASVAVDFSGLPASELPGLPVWVGPIFSRRAPMSCAKSRR